MGGKCGRPGLGAPHRVDGGPTPPWVASSWACLRPSGLLTGESLPAQLSGTCTLLQSRWGTDSPQSRLSLGPGLRGSRSFVSQRPGVLSSMKGSGVGGGVKDGCGRCPICREMDDKMGQTSPVIIKGSREGARLRLCLTTDAKESSPCRRWASLGVESPGTRIHTPDPGLQPCSESFQKGHLPLTFLFSRLHVFKLVKGTT